MMGLTKECVDNLDEITKWPLLIKSSLDTTVLMNIESNFASFPGLSCGIIQTRSVALLEEISSEEAIRAVEEFCSRYRWASHKIHRSVAGYFRGVCKKYWKLNREAKKQELMLQCEDASMDKKAKIIDATIDILFTKASELCKDLVDSQKRRLLLKFNCTDAIEALYEFCNAAMYREHKIRSMHAYLLNIIKRRDNPAGNRSSKSNYISQKAHYRTISAKSSREQTREPSSISQSPQNDIQISGEEQAGGIVNAVSTPTAEDIKVDVPSYKSVQHLSTSKRLDKTNTPGGGEAKNSLDPKDWEPAVLPSKVLKPPSQRCREEMRYRGGNSFRRARRHRRRFPFGQRRLQSGCYEDRWKTEKNEVDPLSCIAMSRAEFTSGFGSSPPGNKRGEHLLCHSEKVEPLNLHKKAYFGNDCDLFDPRLAEPFLGMLENTELEPGAYLPRILDPRFADLNWQDHLTELSPLE